MTAVSEARFAPELLADGSLALDVEPLLEPLVAYWLPLLPQIPSPRGQRRATIRILTAPADEHVPDAPPLLRLGTIRAWSTDQGDRILLAGSGGGRGAIDLKKRDALLTVPFSGPEQKADVYSMMTVTSAVLLGRLGRALVHAASVAPEDGGAWLLVGDTHAGKTSTTTTLIAAGWRFLSDDHTVIGPANGADGAVAAEGWPRRFHLDEGWERKEPLRRRIDVDPHKRWPTQWCRSRPLAGLVVLHVQADQPTAIRPIPPAQALIALIRQSPWLMADPQGARTSLNLMQQAVGLRTYALRLGLDTFANPSAMIDRVGSVLAGV